MPRPMIHCWCVACGRDMYVVNNEPRAQIWGDTEVYLSYVRDLGTTTGPTKNCSEVSQLP